MAIISTGETSGLSLGMYLMFVGGVLLWVTYGVLKRSPSLIMSNLVTACLSGFILTQLLIHTFWHPSPHLPVAICLVVENGAMSDTLLHPRVLAGVREHLLKSSWRLVATVGAPSASSTARNVRAALETLGDPFAGAAFSDWRRASQAVAAQCPLTADDPSGAAPLAYGTQQCVGLVEEAERASNTTFAYVLRARADLLWLAPLPRPTLAWHPAKIIASYAGDDRFAIVPRAALRSYFNAFETLRHRCPMLRAGSEGGKGAPESSPLDHERFPTNFPRCGAPDAPSPRTCIFRVRPALEGIAMGRTYRTGEHVAVPRTATLCRPELWRNGSASSALGLADANATGAAASSNATAGAGDPHAAVATRRADRALARSSTPPWPPAPPPPHALQKPSRQSYDQHAARTKPPQGEQAAHTKPSQAPGGVPPPAISPLALAKRAEKGTCLNAVSPEEPASEPPLPPALR